MKTPIEDINHRFAHHPPDVERVERHTAIRAVMRHAGETVLRRVRPGREQALALTKLEEAMFWANAGIAREEEGSG